MCWTYDRFPIFESKIKRQEATRNADKTLVLYCTSIRVYPPTRGDFSQATGVGRKSLRDCYDKWAFGFTGIEYSDSSDIEDRFDKRGTLEFRNKSKKLLEHDRCDSCLWLLQETVCTCDGSAGKKPDEWKEKTENPHTKMKTEDTYGNTREG